MPAIRLPVIRGVIRRRLLINYRVDAETMRRYLPYPFEPKLHRGYAIAGICLIRLEEIRPVGLPAFFGMTSENAAHRIAITWQDGTGQQREGVFIPRRDTGSLMNHLAGGRVFPGEHQLSSFDVRDDGTRVDFAMRSRDGKLSISVTGKEDQSLPRASCFSSLEESSRFFEGGCSGFSVTSDPRRLDGIRLATQSWNVQPFAVESVHSTYFEDTERFLPGVAEFDHALIMRNVPHTWHTEPEIACSER